MSRYRLHGLLGTGGMASVFEASRILPGEQIMPVACKAMHTGLCDSKRYLDMFYREAALNLQISCDHPGLVTVYDCFQDEDARPYLIMELVHGCTLAHLHDEHESIPFAVVRRILDSMLDALAFVHSKQIIHRDISPGNVLLSTEGVIKLSDFGVAKHIPEGHGRSAVFRGTQAYASPEALRCDAVDARSDLFAVGAVLYEMLTGHVPFGENPDLDAILMRIVDGTLADLPDDVPDDLRDLALGWLQPDPADRHPATAKQALTLLRGLKQPRATRQDIASLVRPIFEQHAPVRRAGKQERAGSMRGDTLEIPVFVHRPDGHRRTVRAESEPDEDERIVTQSGQPWHEPWHEPMLDEPERYIAERSELSNHITIRVSRRVVALCVALALVLAGVYWFHSRGDDSLSERIPAQAGTEPASKADEMAPGNGAVEPGIAENQDASAHKPSRDKPRKVKQRSPRSKTPLPSQQNREIHIVPKADIYKQFEEEE